MINPQKTVIRINADRTGKDITLEDLDLVMEDDRVVGISEMNISIAYISYLLI